MRACVRIPRPLARQCELPEQCSGLRCRRCGLSHTAAKRRLGVRSLHSCGFQGRSPHTACASLPPARAAHAARPPNPPAACLLHRARASCIHPCGPGHCRAERCWRCSGGWWGPVRHGASAYAGAGRCQDTGQTAAASGSIWPACGPIWRVLTGARRGASGERRKRMIRRMRSSGTLQQRTHARYTRGCGAEIKAEARCTHTQTHTHTHGRGGRLACRHARYTVCSHKCCCMACCAKLCLLSPLSFVKAAVPSARIAKSPDTFNRKQPLATMTLNLPTAQLC